MSDGYIGEDSIVAPDLTDYVIGVRGFDRAGHMLASPFQGDEWRVPELRASCVPSRPRTAAALRRLGTKPPAANSKAAQVVERQERLRAHAAPGDDCACGIYGYYEVVDSVSAFWPIVAAVRAWGKLMLHATGFRAERVRVVALALADNLEPGVPGDRCREVARRASAWWKVPLLRLEELAASLPEFGSPIPEQLRPPKEDSS
jgi:hypothetical protein